MTINILPDGSLPIPKEHAKKIIADLCCVSPSFNDFKENVDKYWLLSCIGAFDNTVGCTDAAHDLLLNPASASSSRLKTVTAGDYPTAFMDFTDQQSNDAITIRCAKHSLSDASLAYGSSERGVQLIMPYLDVEVIRKLLGLTVSLESFFDATQKEHSLEFAKLGLPPLWRILFPQDESLGCGFDNPERRMTREEYVLYRAIYTEDKGVSPPHKYYFYDLIPDDLTAYKMARFPESFAI